MNTPNTCSSHMPILLEFFNNFPVTKAVEFGGGYFSTAVFMRAPQLWTVEASPEWLARIQKRFGHRNHWELMPFKSVYEVCDKLDAHAPFDVVLVDGYERSRMLQWALNSSPVVFLHDAQYTWSHGWPLRPGWHRVDFKQWPHTYSHEEAGTADKRPWTSLFTARNDVLAHFAVAAKDEPGLYARHAYPYGLDIPEE